MTDLIIDMETVERTAKALETLNPGRASAAHICDMIRANIRPFENTYISTCGWVAYTWSDRNDPNLTHVRVSLEPYTVNKFLESRVQ